MALPAAFNQISIGNIQTEFGGSNPAALSEYYKNGSYVLSSDTAPNVPTSGTIKLSNFHSAAKIVSTSHTIVEGGSGGNALGFTSKNFQGITGTIGSCTPTSTIGSRTISGWYMYLVKGFSTVYLIVDGDQTGTWWTYGTYNGTTFYRTNCSTASGTYTADDGYATDYTTWIIADAEEPGFSGAKTDTLVLYA